MSQAYAETLADQVDDSDEITRLRRDALARFAATGYPTSKNEDWRFTPITPIAKTNWKVAGEITGTAVTSESIAPFLVNGSIWTTLVFVNGRFDTRLSHRPRPVAGVAVETLAEALAADPSLLGSSDATPFAALNSAGAQDGVVVRVSAGVEVADPIQFLYVTTPEAEGCAVQVRNTLRVAQGARVQFIESYAGLTPAVTFTNAVTEVSVGDGAWVEHSRIQRESETAYHMGLTEVEQGRDSHYRSFTLAMGGAIARHDLRARLGNENVETLLYGLYLARGTQLVDNHTTIFHDRPNCRSWEVYKGILDDTSHAVFNGKVFVKPEAQKTDAKQTNRNLLLSAGAKVNTKPQLEIFADDVRCTHGATVGRLDEVAFFYLQSRGIPRAEAQRLLVYAFAAEVVSEVASVPVREALDRLVLERLR